MLSSLNLYLFVLSFDQVPLLLPFLYYFLACVTLLSSTSTCKIKAYICRSMDKINGRSISINGHAKCILIGHLANQTSRLILCTGGGGGGLGPPDEHVAIIFARTGWSYEKRLASRRMIALSTTVSKGSATAATGELREGLYYWKLIARSGRPSPALVSLLTE